MRRLLPITSRSRRILRDFQQWIEDVPSMRINSISASRNGGGFPVLRSSSVICVRTAGRVWPCSPRMLIFLPACTSNPTPLISTTLNHEDRREKTHVSHDVLMILVLLVLRVELGHLLGRQRVHDDLSSVRAYLEAPHRLPRTVCGHRLVCVFGNAKGSEGNAMCNGGSGTKDVAGNVNSNAVVVCARGKCRGYERIVRPCYISELRSYLWYVLRCDAWGEVKAEGGSKTTDGQAALGEICCGGIGHVLVILGG
ncbi:hypothetical protein BDW22DRAFT_1014760 [Trametopsis cervina]|nr:hypothetical protein BDW22DRAFT_1014760 [Trametopsis cervina]